MNTKPIALPSADDAVRAFTSSASGIWNTLSSVSLPALTQLQGDYLKQATELWNQSLQRLPPLPIPGMPAVVPAPLQPIADRRFSAPAWTADPSAAYTEIGRASCRERVCLAV